MWPYHPELLATPVPRYTSYPTAAEFGPEVGASELRGALETATGDVSLYVHIPFCEAICWYCGCNTGRTNRRDRVVSYLDALNREIALVGAALPAEARIRRIAFGGGSPNAITPTDFVRLMLSLTEAFGLGDPVISIEIDPRTMNAAWADTLAGVRVARASLGVQTFEPALQRAIGRVQPAHLIEDCTELLRKAGITSLNFDLMYGLPGQGIADLDATLQRAIGLGPDRVALFGYAHVPHLVSRQRRIDAAALPSQEDRFRMAAAGHQQLVAAGYSPIGFDHFAIPDDALAGAARGARLHRNFQGFTDDDAPVLIGLGASAISSFPHLLVQNEKNAGRYRMILSQGRLAAARGIARSPEDRLRAGIIEQVLCAGRASVDGSILAEAAAGLRPFAEHGLIEIERGELRLASAALPYARAIAAVFDPFRATPGKRFSSAV